MLTIGEFSQASRLSVKALRIYQEEGLLVPERVDAVNGYRYYGDESFKRARAIAMFRELGFSLAEMRDILSSAKDDEDLAGFFKLRLSEVEKEFSRVRDVRDRLRFFLESGKSPEPTSDIAAREVLIETQWICSIRYRGAYADIGSRFSELFKKAARYAAGKPFAIYYDCGYAEEADIEAAIPVRKEITAEGLSCRKLDGGRFASIVHRGSYERIGLAYKALFDWLRVHGLATAGPTREIYAKGPGMIFPRDPSRFVTEIQVPVFTPKNIIARE